MATIGWIDWALLVVTLLSAVVGIFRGLVFELMSLLGWVGAYVAAQVFSSFLAPQLPIGAPGSSLNQGAAFAIVFALALIVWMLLARLARLLMGKSPLTLMDRMLGGGFGLIRGVFLLLVVATMVSFTPAVRASAWQTSQGAAWLGSLLSAIKPILPADVARHLPA